MERQPDNEVLASGIAPAGIHLRWRGKTVNITRSRQAGGSGVAGRFSSHRPQPVGLEGGGIPNLSLRPTPARPR